MENMEKGLTVPKLFWTKIPQIPQNLSAQFVYPSPKVLDFNEKRFYLVSVVRAQFNYYHRLSLKKSSFFSIHEISCNALS